MKTLEIKKIVLFGLGLMLISGIAFGKDDKPVASMDEQKILLEIAHEMAERELQRKLVLEAFKPSPKIKIYDADGNLVKELAYEGELNWSEYPEIKKLISKSEFLVEYQNTMFYLLNSVTEKK
jgi:hypothetical protein